MVASTRADLHFELERTISRRVDSKLIPIRSVSLIVFTRNTQNFGKRNFQ